MKKVYEKPESMVWELDMEQSILAASIPMNDESRPGWEARSEKRGWSSEEWTEETIE